MSVGGELPIVQGVQEKLLAKRPQSLHRSRVAWVAPSVLGWNNINLFPGDSADPAVVALAGVKHITIMVTDLIGFGTLILDDVQERTRNSQLVHEIFPAFALGLGPIILGTDGDFFTEGLRGDVYTIILKEDGGEFDVTFTASIYLTVN